MAISTEKEGLDHYSKTNSSARYGKYSEIRTSEYEFHFNLNGEVKFIRGLNVNWPHPFESLKRTDGNDWVFYSVGSVIGKGGIKDWLGEYYLPCLPYRSNSIYEYNPFADAVIMQAFASWYQLYANLYELQNKGMIPSEIEDFLNLVSKNDDNALYKRGKELHSIIGGQVSVLPPDSRYVDYNVIPLMIADGCLYQCKFCCVKSQQSFKPRKMDNILEQIQLLKTFYGQNLVNYNGLFIGNHDALAAGDDLLYMAASEAFKSFNFKDSYLKEPKLFLFGSVDSLLKAEDGLFKKLNNLPFYTYINIGLESVHAHTLASIHKPIDISKIHDAFQKLLQINRDYDNMEITANFIIGENLPSEHNQSLIELLENVPDDSSGKGTIYLSPLMESLNKLDLLPSFFEIKKQSRLPVFTYLIQRL